MGGGCGVGGGGGVESNHNGCTPAKDITIISRNSYPNITLTLTLYNAEKLRNKHK